MKRETRSTVILAIVPVVLLGALLFGGYVVLNHIFPMADPVDCPEIEEIQSASIAQESGVPVPVRTEDLATLLQIVRNARPTRKMSVNDYPTVKDYYTVEIHTLPRVYRYFIYTENSRVYIESPYEGIYKADPGILVFLAAS